jgi:hypothetical protein
MKRSSRSNPAASHGTTGDQQDLHLDCIDGAIKAALVSKVLSICLALERRPSSVVPGTRNIENTATGFSQSAETSI